MENPDSLLVVWSSRTGNLKRFVARAGYDRHYQILDPTQKIDEPFLLLTYTASFGDVPREVAEFLSHNGDNLRYVVGSGNRNWGEHYCRGAKEVAKAFDVPLLQTFELMGTSRDLEDFRVKLHQINGEKLP